MIENITREKYERKEHASRFDAPAHANPNSDAVERKPSINEVLASLKQTGKEPMPDKEGEKQYSVQETQEDYLAMFTA
jgi:hypothetical protein